MHRFTIKSICVSVVFADRICWRTESILSVCVRVCVCAEKQMYVCVVLFCECALVCVCAHA